MILCVSIGNNVVQNAPVPLRGHLNDTIRQATEIGFKGLEIHLNKPSEVDVSLLNYECEKYDIKVCAIATGGAYIFEKLSLSSSDENIRVMAVERVKAYVDLATKIGDPVVIIGYIKGLASEAGSLSKFIENYRKSLRECIDYAEQKKIVIVMEAINKYDGDTFHSIGECSEFIRSFNSPNFKLHIDTYHMAFEEKDIVNSIVEAKDLIALVDISDENRMYPDGNHYNFKETIDALKKIDYQGVLNFEYINKPSGYEAAVNGYKYIKSLL